MAHDSDRDPNRPDEHVAAVRHGVAVVDGDAAGTPAQWPLHVATGCFAALLAGLALADRLAPPRATGDLVERVATTAAVSAPSLDPAWLHESPPPLPKHPVPPAMLAAWLKVPQLMFLCRVNEAFLRAMWQPGTGLSTALGPDAPREFDTFRAPDGGPFPAFRYPPGTTLPDGLTTNRFGFRGPDFDLAKPPRTIRIACVGASTTVDAHHFAWSAPELVQHWLDRWAAARGFDVHFEVINAGREAIRSGDIRAIVAQEILPLDVDLVVYYEGKNQCGLSDMLRHVEVTGDYTPGVPPPGLPMDRQALAARTSGALATLRRHSANVRRLLSIAGFGTALPEPEKPAQRLRLPDGLDPLHPDPARAAEVLQLGTILADLDAIRTTCTAAGTRFALASFCWNVDAGMQLDLGEGYSAWSNLNSSFWPLSYANVRALSDLQNRFYADWAAARGVPFLDLAAQMPRDPRLSTDAVHTTELGSRLRGWLLCAGLVRLLEPELRSGALPKPPRAPGGEHPCLLLPRRLGPAELDRR